MTPIALSHPDIQPFLSVQCYAMHGQNINLSVCVCVCLSVRVCLCVCHTFCQLAYRSDPSTDFFKDADLPKNVPFGGLDDE